MLNKSRQRKVVLGALFGYWMLLWLYAVWSYALIDPNLTLIAHPTFLSFLEWTKVNFLSDRQVLSTVYVIVIVLLSLLYVSIAWLVRFTTVKFTVGRVGLLIMGFMLLVLPLLISYNALSHDVFNYIFNARMVLEYGANPHVQTALDFASDDWTRFMHNTHTAAPYWYGWTGLSLLPYVLGFGKFLSTWFMYKLFAAVSVVLVAALALTTLVDSHTKQLRVAPLVLLVLNPLLLLEIVGNAHNDLWMMLPAVASTVLLLMNENRSWPKLGIAVALLFFSVSTKYATIVLGPVWLLIVLYYVAQLTEITWFTQLQSKMRAVNQFASPRMHQRIVTAVYLAMSISMFFLLLLPRSRWFLPWYLTWPLVFLPFMKASLVRVKANSKHIRIALWMWTVWLIALSSSALLRYVPWLLSGEYSAQVNTQQLMMTWLGGVVFALVLGIVLYHRHTSI